MTRSDAQRHPHAGAARYFSMDSVEDQSLRRARRTQTFVHRHSNLVRSRARRSGRQGGSDGDGGAGWWTGNEEALRLRWGVLWCCQVLALPLTHSPKGRSQRLPTAQFLGVEGRMAVGCDRVGPDPGHRRERVAVSRKVSQPGVVRELLCHFGLWVSSPVLIDQLSCGVVSWRSREGGSTSELGLWCRNHETSRNAMR